MFKVTGEHKHVLAFNDILWKMRNDPKINSSSSTYCTSISYHKKVHIKLRHLHYSGLDYTIGKADRSTFT